jgi:tripartite-type tricarboxylate transporter receptor subunit TctC
MKKLLLLSLCLLLAGGALFAAGASEEAVPTFEGKNVRVVIGSTSTGGDSYLIAETVSRYLGKALGANLKVDAVGAAVALDAMQTVKPDGNTIMMFHDMTYLGISFGAYDEMYSLENMTVGPRIAQNPGSAWGAKVEAPYESLAEIPEYLKKNPNAVVRMACEAGGVSHVGFIVYWQWVMDTYGADIADRIRVVIGGSTGDKLQMLWDGNADVIFADYTSLLQYTQTDDPKLAMKYMALLDNIDGVNETSYADQGITLDGKEFRFAKDFLIYLPKDFPTELVAELDVAMKSVNADPGLRADLGKMNFRPGKYLNAEESKQFIYAKRDSLQGLIDKAPSLDDLVL